MEKDNSLLRESIVADIKAVLDQCNPYVKTYRMIRDKIQEENLSNFKLRLIGKSGRDSRTYNVPTVSEVAALIVGDFDAADYDRDIIVEYQTGALKRISLLSKFYLPLQYPLLFPNGEDGWTENIPLKDDPKNNTRKRQTVSIREFFAYMVQYRQHQQSPLLFSKRLFQQFLVDVYSMVEASRLKFIRTHQKELRAELYRGLTDAVLRGETNAATAGKRIVLPSTFTGSARYLFQNYQDAMAICRWCGYPDLFITFTCNQKWPELTRVLSKHGLKPEDRPGLLSRIFKMKLDEMIKDIKKGGVFGKVKAGMLANNLCISRYIFITEITPFVSLSNPCSANFYAVVYTIEFQKRGLPHAHILIFLHPQYRYQYPADIDRIISAEIPDPLTDPGLFDIVSTLMIHGPCGVQNRNSVCMKNGKCSKHFPKNYVGTTTFSEDGYPIYRRRDNGRTVKKGNWIIDNRFVVPYNRYLLMRYNAHINV